MPDFVPPPGGGLAHRLADARRRLADLDLPRPQVTRLHRQFIAVCDAVKAPGADESIGERRLEAFLAALEEAAGEIPRCRNSRDNS